MGQGLVIHEVSRSHTKRHSTVGRTPLDEWSASHRDLYLTTHNTHNRETSMPPVGFEPTISAGERSQTYALDRAATGTGWRIWIILKTENSSEIDQRNGQKDSKFYFQTNVTSKCGQYLSGLDKSELRAVVNSLKKCGKYEEIASFCLEVCRIDDTISYTHFASIRNGVRPECAVWVPGVLEWVLHVQE